MLSLFAKLGPWFIGILGAIGGVFAIFASAKATGAAEGKATAAEASQKEHDKIAADSIKDSEKANAKQMQAVQNANDSKDDANKLNDGDALKQLHDNYSRD